MSSWLISEVYLRDEIRKHFTEKGLELNLKYIDPSYEIRSVPANANDRIYCGFLGQQAVHAGMSGKTQYGRQPDQQQNRSRSVEIGHKPKKSVVDPRGSIWLSVLESTGQPPLKV